MSTEYDEKGKIFTNVISKISFPATIQTLTHRIQGRVYARPGNRLKDELDQAERFIAVTDAVVYGKDLEILYRCEFLAVNRDHIIWLMQDDEGTGCEAAEESSK